MRIFANGGGSGEKVKDIYLEINSLIDHDKEVLYVPLAMEEDKHPYDGCLDWFKNEISLIEASGIHMVRSFEEFASLNFNDYSFIFIGGGNTFRLLNGLKSTLAYNKLKEYILNDGIVFGGSAGAVIMGRDVSCSMDINYVNLNDTKGLDVLNGYSLFPHYTNYKSKLSLEENQDRFNLFRNRIINYTKIGNKIYAIPEEDTIIVKDSLEIVGSKPYFEYNNGEEYKKEIESNSMKR